MKTLAEIKFRQELRNVIEGFKEVAKDLNIKMTKQLKNELVENWLEEIKYERITK